MHLLVELQHLTRREFLRGLEGVSDEDARKRIEPMNCISWIIGHMAEQEHRFFVAGPNGIPVEPAFKRFGSGSEASQPPLEEVMDLWRAATEGADRWLHAATEESMAEVFVAPDLRSPGENAGTFLVRNIFHYWTHTGEISAIRQMLGHRAPQFVSMHRWMYPGS